MANGKIKILMVEDEKDLAEIYSMQMRMLDIEVTIAYDGAQAFDFMQKDLYDLVLLDLFMPEVDGFEVLKKIRQNPKYKSAKIYAWSNLTQKKQIELAKNCGATDFLIKSDYTPKTLAEKVKELVSD